MSDDTPNANLANSRFANVPVEILVSVGTARPKLRDLLALETDGIVPLDRRIDEPVELYVGETLIARGELQEIGEDGSGQIGVRITEVLAAASDL